MDKRIKSIIKLYFDDICYSAEVVRAQEHIEAALNHKLEELAADKPQDNPADNPLDIAFEELIGQYGTLTAMAALAGYTSADVAKWRSFGEAQDLKTLKKGLRRQYWTIIGISVLSVLALTELTWLLYDLFAAPLQAVFVFAIFAVLAGGIVFLYRMLCRFETAHQAEKYDTDAFRHLYKVAEKYAKRRLNTIALLCTVIAVLGLSEIGFYVFGNSKSNELIENFFQNILLLQIPVFFCFKNGLYQKLLNKKSHFPKEEVYKKHLRGITLFSALYWLCVTAGILLFNRFIQYPGNWLMLFIVLFGVLLLLYNFTTRRRFTHKNIVFNKARVAVVTAAALLFTGYVMLQRDTWYTQPYINSVPVVRNANSNQITYNEENGIYTITTDTEEFRILHLTDIHLGGSLYSFRKDLKALKACYAEIAYTQPDLVVVTGDLCFPLGVMSMSLNNSAPVNQFAAFMRNTGVPWAFTYGNHDTEGLATLTGQELNDVYKSLSFKTSGNLLYPYTQPNISGRNNQLIEVRNSDGSLNTALFLIDSNAYTGEGINEYDFIHDDQVEWYANEVTRLNKEEGRTVNSLAFFHIPLQQYRTAYELYEAGSDEVTYFFGENGEKMINKVCCSDFPSALFDRMLELGSTTGLFCGHDHYNNMSLEYKGIRLTYGMSIDYLAMPGIESDDAQRGAELITLHPDGSWDLEQIPLASITE